MYIKAITNICNNKTGTKHNQTNYFEYVLSTRTIKEILSINPSIIFVTFKSSMHVYRKSVPKRTKFRLKWLLFFLLFFSNLLLYMLQVTVPIIIHTTIRIVSFIEPTCRIPTSTLPWDTAATVWITWTKRSPDDIPVKSAARFTAGTGT